jgi:uncharacterized YigZ family protein
VPFSLDPQARPYAEEVIKRSRFVARLRRADQQTDAADLIAEAREHESGANHHCFAYIIGDDLESRVQRFSDDGEPGGTAGAPILHVLAARELVNVAAVVSRHFGGVKLGTGGLARAYAGAVAAALEGVALHPRLRLQVFRLTIGHADAGRVESDLRRRGFDITGVDYREQATLTVIAVDEPSLSSVIAEITSGRVVLVHIGHVWR